MLARLQQLIVVAWLLSAGGWATWTAWSGRIAWLLPGLLLLLTAHALILAIEFSCMHRVNRHDAAPRAGSVDLLRAWWGEVGSATRVFGWRQPFRSTAIPDRLDGRARRGVVFIHGFVCNRGLWLPWLRQLAKQEIPFVAVNLEPVFGAIDDYAPAIASAVERIEAATGLAPVVVAHSMGGLALRRWWAEPGNLLRIHHTITIATPHHGTWLARFAMSPNARQMRLNSAWLQALRQRESPQLGQRMTCFYGHCDNIVFPASTARYPGAEAHHLTAVAHVHMADHPAPWRELMRRLQD